MSQDKIQGLVTKSTGSWYTVIDESGREWNARIRGKFRMEGIRTTNPIAVGDKVIMSPEDDDNAIIKGIEERTNYIIRKSVNLSRDTHMIAANIDQVVLVVTIESPVTHSGFIDRFLVGSESFRIPTVIIFNKVDLYDDESRAKLEELKGGYESVGYDCYSLSAFDDDAPSTLEKILKDKVTLIAGHSGVGKSTLINRLEPNLQLKTKEISDHHRQGQHTTTFAEMFELGIGGYIIDTPGIKGFGVVDIEQEELGHYFPEIRERMHDCKFRNCRHINEPQCAVNEAVESGEIPVFRYLGYLNIYEDLEGDNQYRIDPYK